MKHTIRWMIRRDMAAVMEIETGSYSPETAWTEEDFLSCLRMSNCIGMVAERGDDIHGYMLYTLDNREITLLNLAVHPDRRHRSIGAQLVAKLVSKLSSHRRNRVAAVVRESNLPALKFFASQGFQAVNVLRDHYRETGEDGIRMVRFVPEWMRRAEQHECMSR